MKQIPPFADKVFHEIVSYIQKNYNIDEWAIDPQLRIEANMAAEDYVITISKIRDSIVEDQCQKDISHLFEKLAKFQNEFLSLFNEIVQCAGSEK